VRTWGRLHLRPGRKCRHVWLVVAEIAVVAAMASACAGQAPAGGPAGHGSLTLRGYLRSLRLMNYFPADNAWQYMWTRWEPAQINADLAVIAAMGATSVRVTVFPSVTGFPVPSPVMQSRLAQMAGLASGHGLKVQLSLFDQFTDFTDIPGSMTWARDVLHPFAGSSHVAFIDLRNELDASSTMGRADVCRWVDALLPAVRRDSRGIPVTLSVSEPQHITAMRAALRVEPDFWDLHYYSSDGLAYAIMKQAVRAAGPRPLFVGETGFATAGDAPPGLPAGEASMEAYQAHYDQVIGQAALSLGLGAAAPWTLFDFRPAAIPGRQPPAQYAFGLLHAGGAPKPAAAVIGRLFRAGSVSQSDNNGFSHAVITPDGLLPAIWRRWQPGPARFAWDPAVGHDAPGSARISDSDGTSGSMPAFYTVPVQAQAAPGHRYRVTAWVRGLQATGTTVVNITWFSNRGVFLSGADSARLPGGDAQWTELEASSVAPRGAAFAEIWLKSAGDSGTVWFDDVTWTRPA
jgi:hypothetical protein